MHVLPMGIGFDFDTLVAALVLGLNRTTWQEKWRLSLAFGLCDAAGTVLGSFWFHGFPVQPFAATYLCLVLLIAWTVRGHRRLQWILPLCLGVDNLFGSAPVGDAFGLGVSSMMMGLGGFCLAELSRRALASQLEV